MRQPIALLLVAAIAAGCASDRAPQASMGTASDTPAAPAPRIGPAPAALIGLAVGAGLIILLIANSGLSPSPDPPG